MRALAAVLALMLCGNAIADEYDSDAEPVDPRSPYEQGADTFRQLLGSNARAFEACTARCDRDRETYFDCLETCRRSYMNND